MSKDCETCAHKSDFKAVECGSCMTGYIDGVQQGKPSNWKPKPMTNADRIRAMSDEELEAFLIDVDLDKAGSPFITEWGEWLKQPAEGD